MSGFDWFITELLPYPNKHGKHEDDFRAIANNYLDNF